MQWCPKTLNLHVQFYSSSALTCPSYEFTQPRHVHQDSICFGKNIVFLKLDERITKKLSTSEDDRNFIIRWDIWFHKYV